MRWIPYRRLGGVAIDGLAPARPRTPPFLGPSLPLPARHVPPCPANQTAATASRLRPHGLWMLRQQRSSPPRPPVDEPRPDGRPSMGTVDVKGSH